MHLIQLEPERVSDHWDEVLPMLNISLPDTEELDKRNSSLLRAIIAGALVCWAIMDDNDKMVGFGSTTINIDGIVGEKELLIYTLFSNGDVTAEQWYDALDKLLAYARGRGCARIISYTNNKRMLALYRRYGGGRDVTKVMLEV